MKRKSNRGGKRPGAGRPKGEPTTTIRVPVDVAAEWRARRTAALSSVVIAPNRPDFIFKQDRPGPLDDTVGVVITTAKHIAA